MDAFLIIRNASAASGILNVPPFERGVRSESFVWMIGRDLHNIVETSKLIQ